MIIDNSYETSHTIKVGGVDFNYAPNADFLRKGYDHSVYFGDNKDRVIAVIMAESRKEGKSKFFIVPLPLPGIVGERDINAQELRALLREASKKEGVSLSKLEREVRALRN